MTIDLQHAKARAEDFRAQVCVIGAGIAGLTLAHRLIQQGINVAVLEAGSRTLDTQGEDLYAAAHLTGQRHLGTTQGRFRVFGGSSVRWGGQLLPLPQEAAWPISNEKLAPFTAQAQQLLGVDDLPVAAPEFFAQTQLPTPSLLGQLPQLQASLSKWVTFSRRNLAATLGRDLIANHRATLYLNAQATELLLSPSRTRIDAVLVKNPAGSSFRFEADHFIVAAGTVETSRLLLASRTVDPEGVGNTHDQVGRNFHDHLTLPAATLTGTARERLLRELRPWIIGRTLHSAKLQASPKLCSERGWNPVLAHLTIEEPEDSGIDILRQTLLAGQRGTSRFQHLTQLPGATVEALHLLWSAKLYHRRFVSARARVQLYLNAAQDVPSLSRITLSTDTDPNGVPQATVDWQITEKELATLREFAAHLREQLQPLGHDEDLDWNADLFTPNTPLRTIDDARHAMGGACMGSDPRTSVVDPNLQVHGIANLSIASPAVFPDGSPQLPTLTLMALCLRLADHLTALLQAIFDEVSL